MPNAKISRADDLDRPTEARGSAGAEEFAELCCLVEAWGGSVDWRLDWAACLAV